MSGQIEIKQSLNKAYRKQRPTRAEIELVRLEFTKMLDRANPKESEEYHKSLLKEFFINTAYSNYFINTKGRSDLVIHNDKSPKSTVGVIIEAKGPGNKTEMPTVDNLNKKGMQQLLLYFLRERFTEKNIELKHLIVTNLNEWFIFDAKEFENITDNPKIKKHFKDFEEGRLLFDKTESFYKEIASPVLEHAKIGFVKIDIRDYEKHLKKQTETGDSKLIELQKILSPTHLLKLPFANDSNTLNKEFYNELLHIIGLEEYKEKSKKLIRRKTKENRNEDSLIEAAITQIISLDKLSQIKELERFGDNVDEQLYNIGLELVITWINRILFLKLLESQIVSYHQNKDYVFLNKEKVARYNDLNTLFFQVLAVETKDRRKATQEKFPNVPYLNSSLFEPTELEKQTIVIGNLPDDNNLPLYKKTIVKSDNEKMNTLEYIFRFLDAYDFSSESKEDIAEENKTLINASVLGLIFEKINGYKDGSFFTPGFITMYMCRETIRRAVVQKFKEQTDFDSNDFSDLTNYTAGTYKKAELDKYNKIINSLKICDPAVGSGHFLVSALNEIITIKAELGILTDDSGTPLRDYPIDAENDELMILDGSGEFFKYDPNNWKTHGIQKTLFHEKQTIIENCLFGVDINPNSVNICRLRLWIELLKNAYYKEDGELETLPNIDINIKCANSLISRYPLDADLGRSLVGSTWDIGIYRLAVMNYRNAENKEQKSEAEKLIQKIKSDFHIGITENEPIRKKRKKIKDELTDLTSQGRLFNQGVFKKDKKIVKRIETLATDIAKLDAEIETINSGAVYRNAIEWRFEFPEVLDEKTGDFIGFDIVIGNPPYGAELSDHEKRLLDQRFIKLVSPVKNSAIYFIYAAHGLTNLRGTNSFIVPKSLCYSLGWHNCASFLVTDLDKLIDSGKAFEQVKLEQVIFVKPKVNINSFYINGLYDGITVKEYTGIHKDIFQRFKVLLCGQTPSEVEIIKTIVSRFNNIVGNYVSIERGLNWQSMVKRCPGKTPIYRGAQLAPYFLGTATDFIDLQRFEEPTYQYLLRPKILNQLAIAHVQNPYPHFYLQAALDLNERLVFETISCTFMKNPRINIKFFLAINNSKLFAWLLYKFIYSNAIRSTRYDEQYVGRVPCPNLERIHQIPLIDLVDHILDITKDNDYLDYPVKQAKVKELKNEIDQMVYTLYGLTPNEIAIVESKDK